MYDNYNYPAGADTPDAPWNEPVIPKREFEVDVEYIIQKKAAIVCTDNYIPEFDEEDGRTYANTDDTNWEEVWDNSNNVSILDMLSELEKYVKQDLEQSKSDVVKVRRLKALLKSCQGWNVYDTTVSEAE